MRNRVSGTAVALVGMLVFLVGILACSPFERLFGGESFTDQEWETIRSLSPLPAVPPDSTNQYADNPNAAALGQKFFFETRYSAALTVGNDGSNGAVGAEGDTGKMGCANCHHGSGFSDTRSNPNNVSLGVKWTPRNAPSMVNVAFYEWLGWAGKQDSLWTQASRSPESGVNTKGNRCGYAHMVWDYYKAEYEAVFTDHPLPPELDPRHPDGARFPLSCKPKKKDSDPDGPWEGMLAADQDAVNRIMANSGKAIAAYERLLVSRNAPFDQFVAGDRGAISDQAKRGLKLFIGKAACVECHSGPFFTDQKFHNLGVAQEGPHVPAEDQGRYQDLGKAQSHEFNSNSAYSDDPRGRHPELGALQRTEADLGAFRTPTLRNMAKTAPYMHAGQLPTLAEVVVFYNGGGGTEGYVGVRDPEIKALSLTDEEKVQLVAFLETLTGEEIPETLRTKPALPGTESNRGRPDIGTVGDNLQFDKAKLRAPAQSDVVLTFTNTSTVYSHNWVLVQAGTKDEVAAAGLLNGGVDTYWIPLEDSRIIAHSGLLGPGETEEIRFTAPNAGTYQFVCTFPGHSATMFGDFVFLRFGQG